MSSETRPYVPPTMEEFKVAPNFEHRLNVDRIKKEQVTAEERIWWKEVMGEYMLSDILNVPPVSRFENFDNKLVRTLVGSEICFYHAIQDQLAANKDRPIVVMDNGAGFGLTFHKIALLLSDEITQGHLVVVTTSLPKDLERFRDPKVLKLPNDVDAVLEASNGLVQEIETNTSSLLFKSVKLPSGDMIPLKGNVGFVHDRLAIAAHSEIPDLEAQVLLELLSPRGIAVFEDEPDSFLDKRIHKREGGRLNQNRIDHDVRKRTEAFYLGIEQATQNFNLTRVTNIESDSHSGQNINGRWTMLKGQSAPAIRA